MSSEIESKRYQIESDPSAFVLSLSSNKATLSIAGGKGKNLSELIRAGFRVPPGFIVTTDAYKLVIKQNGIAKSISAVIGNAGRHVADSVEEMSEELRKLFKGTVVPDLLFTEIRSSYRSLAKGLKVSNPPVAVRSSATAEDLPGLTFAGQQDTFLNVIGEDQLIASVKKCWSSLWTSRAILYRQHNDIPSEGATMAIVIQAMVDSESSGVVFTANPTTGRRDEIVINASHGLGESVVSGLVTPDMYVVDAANWKIARKNIGAKQLMVVPEAGGGTRQVHNRSVEKEALSDEQIVQLARISSEVERRFGHPQDIEWGFADGEFNILQSRHITSLYPLPISQDPTDELQIYVNFNSIQGVTGPLTPLGIDVFRELFGGARKLFRLRGPMSEYLPDAGGRLFMKLTVPLKSPRLRKLVLAQLADTEPGTKRILSDLIRSDRIENRPAMSLLRGGFLIASLIPMLARVVRAMILPEKAFPRVVNIGERFLRAVREHADRAANLHELLSEMKADMSAAEEISFRVMPTTLPAYGLIPVVDRWLVKWLGEAPGSALELMQGIPNNVTTEMNLKLWESADRIRKAPSESKAILSDRVDNLVSKYSRGELPAVAQDAIREFLITYGMRAVAEIDIGRRRWREDPTPIFQTVLSYLQLTDDDRTPAAVFQRNKSDSERLVGAYERRMRQTPGGWFRAKLFKVAMKRIRSLAGIREIPLYYMVIAIDAYRNALLKRVGELVSRGVLQNPEDVFFVPLSSLEKYTENVSSQSSPLCNSSVDSRPLKEIARQNRADYDREALRKRMPRVLLSTGESFYDPPPETSSGLNDLHGEAVSPGVVEGIARVVLDPRSSRLQPGEILVCPSTDPGWTPLFLSAAGLVMEIGGMITHGSIVAREYGIPAVVSVVEATTRLHTGQKVRVDGNLGIVTIIE